VSMSKKRKKFDRNQLSIFDLLRSMEKQEADTQGMAHMEGQFKCVDRLRASLRAAIKACPLSVHQIAGEMSHLSGQTITAEVIYSWTRDSDEINGRNIRHIPAEWLPAFCFVTKCNDPLVIMGRLVRLFVLPGPEALRAEIQRLDEAARAIKAEKRKRQAFLKEMGKQAKEIPDGEHGL